MSLYFTFIKVCIIELYDMYSSWEIYIDTKFENT